MRNHLARAARTLPALLLVLALIPSAAAVTPPEDKPKPEEVIARHLASVGSAEDLAALKSLVAIGAAKAYARTGVGREFKGVGQFASQGDRVLFALLFDSNLFPFEKAGYNGESLTVAQLPDGHRSALGDFMMSHGAPFKQGLIGGVLSTAWPLRAAGADAPRLSYAGTDKVEGRKAHKLRYDPRKSGGLQITLFFDAETFRHVRTEYQISIAARMGRTAEMSVSQLESRYRVLEDFSDFRPQGKLTLPHSYRLSYTIEEQNATRMLEWSVAFTQFAFNEQIDDKAFSVLASK
ncbi:MAG TPA: hypothetical protein VF668_12875 [Pyrinomonadaceae bacterium]|jgi:hypothetical protein